MKSDKLDWVRNTFAKTSLTLDENIRTVTDGYSLTTRVMVGKFDTPHDNLTLKTDGTKSYIESNGDEDGLFIKSNTAGRIYLQGTVVVGITDVTNLRTTLKDKFSLFVRKGVVSENFAIINVSDWKDNILRPDYQLRSLSEVESFISENGHLPDVPSEKTIKDEGYEVHEMNKILMQKIEELTLYVIQQQKEIDVLKTHTVSDVKK